MIHSHSFNIRSETWWPSVGKDRSWNPARSEVKLCVALANHWSQVFLHWCWRSPQHFDESFDQARTPGGGSRTIGVFKVEHHMTSINSFKLVPLKKRYTFDIHFSYCLWITAKMSENSSKSVFKYYCVEFVQ